MPDSEMGKQHSDDLKRELGRARKSSQGFAVENRQLRERIVGLEAQLNRTATELYNATHSTDETEYEKVLNTLDELAVQMIDGGHHLVPTGKSPAPLDGFISNGWSYGMLLSSGYATISDDSDRVKFLKADLAGAIGSLESNRLKIAELTEYKENCERSLANAALKTLAYKSKYLKVVVLITELEIKSGVFNHEAK